MNSLLPLGIGSWAFISIYLLSLLLIGWLAKKARTENTLKDFYLAGNGLGVSVLFLTLFATQYSGNTFLGFTGATYRIGFPWILSIHFMTSIVVCYLLFAEKLHLLAKKNKYITPTDYIIDRYKNGALAILVSVIMIVCLSNYLLAQLMAMGRVIQGIANTTSLEAYIIGVILLAFIIVAYGTLGGLRAVAWTDAIQGSILLVGFIFLITLLFHKFGSFSEATEIIRARDFQQNSTKSLLPSAEICRQWISYILVVGFGLSLYPQAIQRIYAAKSVKVLKKSIAVMAFMPIPTMIIIFITGIMALAYLPGIEGVATDQIFGRVLKEIQSYSIFGYILTTIIISAVLAAMMSTADSALLSISSMITKDLYMRKFFPDTKEEKLTMIGKYCSWIFLIFLVIMAIILQKNVSLVALMDRKLDLLIQLSPAFILGIRWKKLLSWPVFLGIIIGVFISLVLAFGDWDFVNKGKIWGFHPGILGIIPNLIVAVFGTYILQKYSQKNKNS